MIEIKITGIRKDNGNHYNPFEAVEAYRWEQPGTSNGKLTERSVVVGWLDNGIDGNKVKAYVHRVEPRADCFVNESSNKIRFLQTEPDATNENNLLELPEV